MPGSRRQAGPAPPEGIAISGNAGARTPGAGPTGPSTDISRGTFREVFALGEFRALWLSQVLSVTGDQLARVALTLLVFDQTRSALLAAVTFAASVVPSFVGGITLAGLADRWSRRAVMIVCDLISAVLAAVMAVRGMPLAALVALLFAVTMVSAPFTSARAALFPDVLTGDRYVVGTAITLTTIQFAQVAGFALGGVAVGLLGVHTSLLVDAATFALSALITRIWVRARPVPHPRHAPVAERESALTGIRVVFTNPALRVPMLFGWLAAFYNVPEGVSAPLATTLGGGALAVGLILAAPALGASVGSIAFSRFVSPPRRLRWMSLLAVIACAVLATFVFHPPLPIALVILGISGIFDCYQLAANASFVTAAPARYRSRAFGVAQAGMSLGQGVTIIIAGALAERVLSPSDVIAVTGALGALCAVVIALGHRRK